MPVKPLDWEEYNQQKEKETVLIYRNLNNGLMSLKHKVDGNWKLMAHVASCVIAEVEFHVSEKGRQRVIREKVKNVHAWGMGKLIAEFDADIVANIPLGYDPYHTPTLSKKTPRFRFCAATIWLCATIRCLSVLTQFQSVKRPIARSEIRRFSSLYSFGDRSCSAPDIPCIT